MTHAHTYDAEGFCALCEAHAQGCADFARDVCAMLDAAGVPKVPGAHGAIEAVTRRLAALRAPYPRTADDPPAYRVTKFTASVRPPIIFDEEDVDAFGVSPADEALIDAYLAARRPPRDSEPL